MDNVEFMGNKDWSNRAIECRFCYKQIPAEVPYWRFTPTYSRNSRGVHITCMLGILEDFKFKLNRASRRS